MKGKSNVVVVLSLLSAIGLLFINIQLATPRDRDRDSDSNRRGAEARDPGVRPGTEYAGGPMQDLTENQLMFFVHGMADFLEEEEVDEGIGPRMNLDSCGGCHAHPAIGGSSPAINPQFEFANKAGGTDRIPYFVTRNGPVREARFVRNPDGTPDGGVHGVFTISGREGAADCFIEQPDFEGARRNGNIVFRIPTPLFGSGLIEMIPDSVILDNQAVDAPRKRALGIRGRPNFVGPGNRVTGAPNRNGNDGTVARFGWKAQNVSLLMFSGEAYNVEMGITSELFQNERDQTPECQYAMVPNDTQDFDADDALTGTTAIQNFSNFQRFLAPPKPSTDTPGGAESIARGKTLFDDVGCATCHTPTLRTGTTSVAALYEKEVHLYSDLMVHDMGPGLADGVSQGQAGPNDFRTAPLWGVGQRIFFLHDGRTDDLLEAIKEHRSGNARSRDASEANAVIDNFSGLPEDKKQDLLNFLRSL